MFISQELKCGTENLMNKYLAVESQREREYLFKKYI